MADPQAGGQPPPSPPQRGVGDFVKEAVEKIEQAREQAQQAILRAREDAERKSREAEKEKQAISQAEQQLGALQQPADTTQKTLGDLGSRVEQVSLNKRETDDGSEDGAEQGKELRKPNEPNWSVVIIAGVAFIALAIVAIFALTKENPIIEGDHKKLIKGVGETLKEPLEKIEKATEKISAVAEKMSTDVAEIKGAIGTEPLVTPPVTPPTPVPAKSLRQLALEGIRNTEMLSGKIDSMEKKFLSAPNPNPAPSPVPPTPTDAVGKKD